MRIYVRKSFLLKKDAGWMEMPIELIDEKVRHAFIYLLKGKEKIPGIKAIREIFGGDNVSLLQGKMFVEWCQMSTEEMRDFYSTIKEEVEYIESETSDRLVKSIDISHAKSIQAIWALFQCFSKDKIEENKDFLLTYIQNLMILDSEIAYEIYYSLKNFGLEMVTVND